jgi:hypothetical protein
MTHSVISETKVRACFRRTMVGVFAVSVLLGLVLRPVNLVAMARSLSQPVNVADEDSKKKEPGAWELIDAVRASASAAKGLVTVMADVRLPTVCHEAIVVPDRDDGKLNTFNLLGRQIPDPGEFCQRPTRLFRAKRTEPDKGFATIQLVTARGVEVLKVSRATKP